MRYFILSNCLLLLLLLCLLHCSHMKSLDLELTSDYWIKLAQLQLKSRIERRRLENNNNNDNKQHAKNIIFFLGDGLSISTLTAARILKGQRAGQTGEESKLIVEDFPYVGLSKTYCVNVQTADSACSGTAYLSGVKTNRGTIGLNAQAKNCEDSINPKYQTEAITLWAQRAGKSTGIVTTTRITDASPACAYAHSLKRNWESDNNMSNQQNAAADDNNKCMDIAKQLIMTEPGRNIDVILGGGMSKFLPNTIKHGERYDGINLIEHWQTINPNGKFVRTLNELQMALNETSTSTSTSIPRRLFGLFSHTHMKYNLDSNSQRRQPRLYEMTAAAINILKRNVNGYFVFIEGGLIDHGHHETKAGYALDETLEFDKAIATALSLTNSNETLIVVTADHSHTMTMSGYAGRGTPILGLDKNNHDRNNIPYSTLNYALGKMQYTNAHGKRIDPSKYLNETYYTPSYIPTTQGKHAGEDVPIFAYGPQAQLFSGVMEQHLLPHLISYAACLGNGITYCKNKT